MENVDERECFEPTYFLSELLPESGSNMSGRNLFVGLASDPGLLMLSVGPLFFLGAAQAIVFAMPAR